VTKIGDEGAKGSGQRPGMVHVLQAGEGRRAPHSRPTEPRGNEINVSEFLSAAALRLALPPRVRSFRGRVLGRTQIALLVGLNSCLKSRLFLFIIDYYMQCLL